MNNSATLINLLLRKQMPDFTYPKYERRANDNYYPVYKFQTLNIEELLQTWYFNHCNLTYEDNCHNRKQAIASLEMQCAASRLKCSGIEEIEEVGHYEGREEQC